MYSCALNCTKEILIKHFEYQKNICINLQINIAKDITVSKIYFWVSLS